MCFCPFCKKQRPHNADYVVFAKFFLRIFGRDRRKNQLTDKELHKLNRKELLELMLDQSRQLDDLREQLRQAQEQLTSRQLLLNKAGSIAEASLQLNRVFEAAQAAAEQYLENVQTLSGRILKFPDVIAQSTMLKINASKPVLLRVFVVPLFLF